MSNPFDYFSLSLDPSESLEAASALADILGTPEGKKTAMDVAFHRTEATMRVVELDELEILRRQMILDQQQSEQLSSKIDAGIEQIRAILGKN